ncbi:MAG: ribose-phosphate diphosphokinase [Candidatus Buchananbacteria bacterium]|nr:ribose-phosphate diphosphokinase [Candidatus Buchananbacteria bacterium]
MYLFSLPNTKNLAKKIYPKTKFNLGEYDKKLFSNGEIYLQIKNRVRGKTVHILGSTYLPHDNLIEFLILINALKENGAKKITAIIPYFSYARQDKIDQPGSPIAAKLIAGLFKKAGVNQFVTIDIHSKRNQKFLGPDLTNLNPLNMFADHIRKNISLTNTIIVAPDNGAKPRAKKLAKLLNNLPVLVLQKTRPKQNVAKILEFKKNIAGKNIIMTDDMIDTAGTITAACQQLKRHKVKNIHIFATHGILSDPAIKRIQKAPIKKVIITDTYPIPKAKQIKKIKILPITPLLIKHFK